MESFFNVNFIALCFWILSIISFIIVSIYYLILEIKKTNRLNWIIDLNDELYLSLISLATAAIYSAIYKQSMSINLFNCFVTSMGIWSIFIIFKINKKRYSFLIESLLVILFSIINIFSTL